MKKNYMKPEGNVVALRANENIALSVGLTDGSRVSGTIVVEPIDGKYYISGNLNLEAADTGDPAVDAVINAINAFIGGVYQVCQPKVGDRKII